MQTVKDNVKNLLIKYPKTRDNDKILLWYYWFLVDKVMANKEYLHVVSFVESCTPPESITRARRECQEQFEELRASSPVEASRKANEQRIRQEQRLDFKGQVEDTFKDMI